MVGFSSEKWDINNPRINMLVLVAWDAFIDFVGLRLVTTGASLQ